MKKLLATVLACLAMTATAQKAPADYVNPFVGTTNFGTTNPGAVCPGGLMSATPFNVMGSDLNKYDKDKRWWSTPYSADNVYLTGFSHVNLSGVGCPDMGALLLMPTTGDSLEVNYDRYGSVMSAQQAAPGYYSCFLDKYGIRTEVTATPRTAIHRFTFPKGRAHVLLNLGEALSNETGAMVRRTGEGEVEGMKLLGTFCYYNLQGVFPIYFV
ncbi:MAG: glycoside hydrolase family 92 protein, partial [Alloprevotella sp.]